LACRLQEETPVIKFHIQRVEHESE
jgi:hypothetical protein